MVGPPRFSRLDFPPMMTTFRKCGVVCSLVLYFSTHSWDVVSGKFILRVGNEKTSLAYSSVTDNNTLKYGADQMRDHNDVFSHLDLLHLPWWWLRAESIKCPVMEVRPLETLNTAQITGW